MLVDRYFSAICGVINSIVVVGLFFMFFISVSPHSGQSDQRNTKIGWRLFSGGLDFGFRNNLLRDWDQVEPRKCGFRAFLDLGGLADFVSLVRRYADRKDGFGSGWFVGHWFGLL
jgi:Na+-transporting NADH:ubiquinone oxidoreductase subunit NqrB